jgi:hypothetical protein
MLGGKKYKSGFTILQHAQLLGNDKIKPIERHDRFQIDNWKLETSWIVDSFRERFTKEVQKVAEILDLPVLNPENDICSKTNTFIPKVTHVSVNSHFLSTNLRTAKDLEKLIYTNFLLPLGWSYNFYPFVEYFILYRKRTKQPVLPNPLQLPLILGSKKELVRNTYTKSDISFLKQEARILTGATKTRSTKADAHKSQMFELFLKIKASKERPPRNPALKALCFDIYNTMSKDKATYLAKDEQQYNQFLMAKTPDLVDSYESFFKLEINAKYKNNLTDKKAYLALKRYHVEYKNMIWS